MESSSMFFYVFIPSKTFKVKLVKRLNFILNIRRKDGKNITIKFI